MYTQPIKTWTACNNTKHVDRRARGRANSRLHAHTTRQNIEHECPNPDTKPKLMTWVLGSEHHTPTRKAHSHKNRTWWECQDSVTKPQITLDRSDRTLSHLQSPLARDLNLQPLVYESNSLTIRPWLLLIVIIIIIIIMDRCKHGRLYDIKKQGKIRYGPHNINTGSLAVRIKLFLRPQHVAIY